MHGNHEAYLRMPAFTDPESWGASEGVANWYERNIRMFYNINRIADLENRKDRILIIVGQGHKQILQDLVEDAPYYEHVPVVDFLKE